MERDETAGLTFNVVMDLTARGMGLYTLFCVPDHEAVEPYVLAKVQDEPCYIHRCVLWYLCCLSSPLFAAPRQIDSVV